jgi:NB-ARC domain
MGGLGKTELAIQYTRKYLNAYPGGICWVFAGDFETGPQIVKFAEAQLGLKIPEGLELLNQISFCWRHWPSGEVLLVLDDVTDFPKLKPYLPSDLRFKVLLTTRLQLGAPVRSLTLKVLTLETSLNLLSSEFLVGRDRITAEQMSAQRLCECLGYLPLGLELVGRYLNLEPDLSLSMMLFRLQTKALKDESMERDPDDPTWSLTAQRGVAAAFELSWEKLKGDTQRLGRLLSLFALAPIPWRLVVSAEQHRCDLCSENKEFHPEKLNTSRTELIRFHLLQRVEQEVYLLHSLIRKFFQSKLEELDRAAN